MEFILGRPLGFKRLVPNLLNLDDPDEDERYTLTGLRSDQPPPWPTPIHGAKAGRPLGNWAN